MKFLFIIINFGLYYFVFESIFNGFWSKLNIGQKKYNIIGYSSIYNIVLGSIIGSSIYFLYIFIFYKIPMLALMFIFGFQITLIEFLFGLFLNKLLKLNIWDYSWAGIVIKGKRYKLNLLGQINLYFSLLWILLVPTIIYISEVFTAVLFDFEIKKSLLETYARIITDFLKK
jgi:hypothetical protein